jgi:hypothetical protein
MKYPERMAIIEQLSYEARVGFIVYCAERCLSEARRHASSREQLAKLPLLTEALEMLWVRAERGIAPKPERVRGVLDHLQTYEKPAKDSENVDYRYDVTLVEAARMLTKGMNVLLDTEAANPRYVAGAFEGAVMSVGLIYVDGRRARELETAVTDAALERLRNAGKQKFARSLFEGIPDWARGDVTPRYAGQRLTGTKDDE